ncbi:hypothetical protein GUJ93_ZPchr0006g41039 [Zizania palustris]|uniref:Uncharacterized protein n=1 Tax=Zizania palustris TaxID=103762 RepID=A0A8J5VL42_ZIZPA|nr:hypothetical protein GUJ93_ZPchr0006g41039 [Zizania palustris]
MGGRVACGVCSPGAARIQGGTAVAHVTGQLFGHAGSSICSCWHSRAIDMPYACAPARMFGSSAQIWRLVT